MKKEDKIAAFVKLGEKIANLSEEETQQLAASATSQNGWFSFQSVQNAFEGLALC